jgi:pyruvate dehydrogenase E2 component (dihydrolipoamide acetyltransferase)
VTEFKLPELGENIDQGDLVRLMISPGATITQGQAVMELETDKAVVEVPSTVSGVVKEIRVKEGEKIKVGQVIFTFENGAGGVARASSPAEEPKAQQAAAAASSTKASPVEPPAQTTATVVQRERRITSSPATAGPTEFKLPELGENISQGDLVRLMISPGIKVSEGQPVMELETDKAVIEVPSSIGGIIKEVHVKQGDKIKVGDVIFTLEGAAAPQTEPSRGKNGRTGASTRSTAAASP